MRALDLLSNDNFIILNKTLAKEIGIENAIVFGALCSYQRMCGNEEFYKEQEKIIEDTCLTEYLVRKSIKELTEIGLISCKKKGMPAKYYFKINDSLTCKILTSSGAKFDTTGGHKNATTCGAKFDTTKEKQYNKNNNKNNNIKENIKESEKNELQEIVEDTPCNEILNYWNSKDIVKHRSLTQEMSKAIQKALQLGTAQDIKDAIDRYDYVLKDETYFYKYKWTLTEFLTRKNGWQDFLDTGSKWTNYVNSESGKKAMNRIIDNNTDMSDWFD